MTKERLAEIIKADKQNYPLPISREQPALLLPSEHHRHELLEYVLELQDKVKTLEKYF